MRDIRFRRIKVLLLSIIMMLTMMPSASFAAAEDTPGNLVTETDLTEADAAEEQDGGETPDIPGNTEVTEESADAENADGGTGADDAAGAAGETAAGEAGAGRGAGAGDGAPADETAADTDEEYAEEMPESSGPDNAVSGSDGEKLLTAGSPEDLLYPDGFEMSIPVMRITVTKGKGKNATETGQDAIDAMNASEDHSYKCKGTVDIEVPEGFTYVDQRPGTEPVSISGLKLDYIRGRGNSSWNRDKKPYKIKLDEEQPLLGMRSNDSWALLANAYDPTLMRNRLTYWLGRELGMDFTPDACPVDLFVGSETGGYEYYGSYLLTHIPKNYVDIDVPAEDVTEGIELTGGYLLSMVQDGNADVFSTRKEESLQNIDPAYDTEADEDAYDNEVQKTYIRNYIQEAEDSLFEGETYDPDTGEYRRLDYRDYFDMDAASLYWLCQEVLLNGDAYLTGSTYFYKLRDDKGGKICWGPLWDFDYAWDYQTIDPDDSFLARMNWMLAMLHDDSEGGLPDLIRRDWPVMKEKLLYIADEGGLLDQYYEEVRVSQSSDQTLNADKDPDAFPEDGDYRQATEKLRTWIYERIDWMDSHLGDLDTISHKVVLKDDSEDEHPQVFYVRNGETLFCDPDRPSKEGSIFLGWYIEDTEDPDHGRDPFELKEIDRDITAAGRYVTEEDAIGYTDLFFLQDVFGVPLSEGTFMPYYTVLPDDAQNRKITWRSSDTSVATVDGNGEVKLLKTGEVTIEAELSGGSKSSYRLIITEKPVAAERFRLSRDTIYMKPGDIRQLKLIVSPEEAYTHAVIDCNDRSVVTYTMSGKLIALKPGRAGLTLTLYSQREDGEIIEKEADFDVIVNDEDAEGSLITETVTDGITGKAANLAAVAAEILTEEDMRDFFAGADIRVRLEMTAVDDNKVPSQDRSLLQSFMGKSGMTAGQYVDIRLLKKIGENKAEAVHKTSTPLKFTITVPEELRNTDPDVTRTFYLLRAHGGKADCTGSGTGDTIECESSLFSTYLIAYKDTETSDAAGGDDGRDNASGSDNSTDSASADKGNGGNDSSSSKNVKTGDETFLLLWVAVLVIALLLGAVMLVILKRRTDRKDRE